MQLHHGSDNASGSNSSPTFPTYHLPVFRHEISYSSRVRCITYVSSSVRSYLLKEIRQSQHQSQEDASPSPNPAGAARWTDGFCSLDGTSKTSIRAPTPPNPSASHPSTTCHPIHPQRARKHRLRIHRTSPQAQEHATIAQTAKTRRGETPSKNTPTLRSTTSTQTC